MYTDLSIECKVSSKSVIGHHWHHQHQCALDIATCHRNYPFGNIELFHVMDTLGHLEHPQERQKATRQK